MTDVDAVRLNFSASTLHLLNAILGIVMFGVALDMKGDDVRRVVTNPRPVLIGLLGHYLVFPAVTFLLVTTLRPAPSIALGMMLVASCPAGNISNFLVHLAGGNTALAQGGTDLYDLDLTQPTALVFGNEMRGVSDEAGEGADGTVAIPMMGMVESLNISVACAVSLYEALRQRRRAGRRDCSSCPILLESGRRISILTPAARLLA